MKKALLIFTIAASLIACNNASDTVDEQKDSIDSALNEQKEIIDSLADEKKDTIETIKDRKLDSLEKVDSAAN